MHELPEGLKAKVLALHALLGERGIPHAFGGAIAFGFAGVPRSTLDIDLEIFLPVDQAEDVLALLAPVGLAFASRHSLERLQRDGQARLVWDDTPVDLFFPIHEFYGSVKARVTSAAGATAPIPVISAEDIVVFKVLFDRPKDWVDVESVLAVQGTAFDVSYVTGWLRSMLGDDDVRIARLEELARGTWDRSAHTD